MKKNTWLWIVIIVLAAIFLAPNIKKWIGKEEETGTDGYLTVIEADIDYERPASSLNIVRGSIKTSAPIESIVVNVQGVGSCELEYTSSLIQTTSTTYWAHALTPTDGILGGTDYFTYTQLTVDVFIEYDGMMHKVDTQTVTLSLATSENELPFDADDIELPEIEF